MIKDTQKNVGSWILAFLALPSFLFWLFPLLMCCFRLGEFKDLKFIQRGILCGVWKNRNRRFSTCLGRGMMLTKSVMDEGRILRHRVVKHEIVHLRQFEDFFVYGLFLSIIFLLITKSFWCLLLWPLTAALLLVNFLTATLRWGTKGIYRDTEHERSAYAQTDMWDDLDYGDVSWEEIRDIARYNQKGVLG